MSVVQRTSGRASAALVRPPADELFMHELCPLWSSTTHTTEYRGMQSVLTYIIYKNIELCILTGTMKGSSVVDLVVLCSYNS